MPVDACSGNPETDWCTRGAATHKETQSRDGLTLTNPLERRRRHPPDVPAWFGPSHKQQFARQVSLLVTDTKRNPSPEDARSVPIYRKRLTNESNEERTQFESIS